MPAPVRLHKVMRHTLSIPGTLPNLNQYITQLNINKFRGSKLKRDTESYIAAHIKHQLKGVRCVGPVTVEFNWYEPDKKRDIDNVAFAKKFIFDALVTCGVLANDGWACVSGFSDSFAVDRDNPRVEVVLHEQEVAAYA